MPAVLAKAIPAAQLSKLSDPEILLAPQVTTQIKGMFAAFGAQGQALFNQFRLAIRQSLATVFIREIPLRKNHHESPVLEALEEDGSRIQETESHDTESEKPFDSPSHFC
ncbi:MAG TPA: hypothetical protein VGL40_14475 [Bacillota bacterium]|jgi:hypothetical protein